MSFFSALHTFGAWAEKELAKLDNEAPKIEAVADTVIKYVSPALTIIGGMVGGAAGAEAVNAITTEAQRDLVALSGLVHDFGATPTAATVAAAVQSNIGTLLTDGHVTDPAHVASVNKIVNELASLVTALTPKVTA